MTILDVIKYEVTNIHDKTQLKQVPYAVVRKWKCRIKDYALAQAESVVHLDDSGWAQQHIDAIKKYKKGEIGLKILRKTTGKMRKNDSVAAAHHAANSFYHGSEYTIHAYYASHFAAEVLHKEKIPFNELSKMFLQWLQEELINYMPKS